jgi:hypothetical protein
MSMKSSNLSSQKWMSLLSFALFVLFPACRQQASGLDSNKTYLGRNAASQSSKPASIGWTDFQDSFEHAFSLSVPQGWMVQGGLFRFGFSDYRLMVSVKSPDGKIDLRIGDVTIPSYAPPSAYHPREGQPYDLGAQAQLVIARYRTGAQYAVLYSQARFGTLCQNPQQNPSTIDFTMPDYLPMESVQRSSTGQIEWLCQTSDGPRVALTFTRTLDGGQLWQVPTMVSLLAPSDQVEQARNIALQCVKSLKINGQWIAYQRNMDQQGLQYQRMRQQWRRQQISAQIQQFESQMHAMQNQVNAFEKHQAMQAGQVEDFTNALNGITPTTDPLTGEHRIVWTGTRENYWVNGVGQVVNATNAPSSAFHQLQTP